MKIDEERRRAIEDLITEYGIRVNKNEELPFKALMQIRSQLPHFYYDWKKDRTKLLRKKEPAVKEPFHKGYLRKLKKEMDREARRKKRDEERRLADDDAGTTLRSMPSKAGSLTASHPGSLHSPSSPRSPGQRSRPPLSAGKKTSLDRGSQKNLSSEALNI